MRKLVVCFCLLLLAPVFTGATHAQANAEKAETAKAPAAPAQFYHLRFVVEELDAAGKPTNSRSFSTTASTAGFQYGNIVAGTRVPIATAAPISKENGNLQTQYTYVDAGVKITPQDLKVVGDRLSFNLTASVSSVISPTAPGGVPDPVLRQNVWNGTVLVPIGKSTVVFESDSLDSKGSMQLMVTATRVE